MWPVAPVTRMRGPTRKTQVVSPPVKDWPQIRAFRMLLRAHARLSEEHRHRIGAFDGLAISEFDMLAALGNTSGLRMRELAEKMITSPGNVTRVAQALERRGLVVRQRAEHSDREVIAKLTPAGERQFHEHFLEIANFTCGLFDRALTVEETKQLTRLLGKLSQVPKAPDSQPAGRAEARAD